MGIETNWRDNDVENQENYDDTENDNAWDDSAEQTPISYL